MSRALRRLWRERIKSRRRIHGMLCWGRIVILSIHYVTHVICTVSRLYRMGQGDVVVLVRGRRRRRWRGVLVATIPRSSIAVIMGRSVNHGITCAEVKDTSLIPVHKALGNSPERHKIPKGRKNRIVRKCFGFATTRGLTRTYTKRFVHSWKGQRA